MATEGYHNSSRTLGNNERLNTISKRNHAAATEVEMLLWRTLCDRPEALKEYMAEDCIMINPLFSNGSPDPLTKDTSPSIEQVLAGAEPWASFRMHGEPRVVEIDLMAVAVLSRVTLFRNRPEGGDRGGLEEVQATSSSSWRQTAGADWLLCAMHISYAD